MNNKNYLFQEVLVKNPVLVGTIGLCPVVAISKSLKAALIMSAITMVTLIVAQLLTFFVLKRITQWVRLGLYTLIGMAIVIPSMLIVDKFDPEVMLALGIYLPLLAVNPLIVRNCEREAVEGGLGSSVLTSVFAGLGYSAVLIIVGFVRELIGAGSVWEHRLNFIKPAEGFMMPLGGFVVIAFLAAALRAYFRKIDPQLADELVENSRTNIKGSKKAKLQLKGALYADSKKVNQKVKKPKIKRRARSFGSNEKTVKKPIMRSEQPSPEQERRPVEVMTFEKAEEMRTAKLPKVETTFESEIAPSQPSDPKTSRFEFVTLDLNKDTKADKDAERFAAAVAENKREREQRKILNRRGQEKISRRHDSRREGNSEEEGK